MKAILEEHSQCKYSNEKKNQIIEWKKEYITLLEKVKKETDEDQVESLLKSIKLLYFNIVLSEEEQNKNELLSGHCPDNHYHSAPKEARNDINFIT